MSRSAKIVVAVAAIAAVIAAILWLPVADWVRALVTWVRHLGALGVVVYSVVFILIAIPMIPTVELYLAAGLLYGALWGAVLVTALGVVVELLTLLIFQTKARDAIEARLRQHPTIAALDKALHDHSFAIMFLLRLSPLVPFGPLNYALATIDAPLWKRISTNILGMFPCSLMITYVGSYLRSVAQLSAPATPSVWKHVALWGGLATSIAAGVLGVWATRRALARQHPH
ncbi:MAG TPA: VTT domain-containing protein [Kofleriaceae bacterium]|nr:VTT domain-containing protein [Kofleriaceae bacterium]